MPKQPCVYMLASQRNGTLYVGVTSDLVKRIWEHKGVDRRSALLILIASQSGVRLAAFHGPSIHSSSFGFPAGFRH